MAYYRRTASEGDLYHVFARGTGRRIIFEDGVDRAEFVRRLEVLLQQTPGRLHAWCLMGNHFHLVANMRLEHLAKFMERLNGGYARYFNARHGRTGHLFEGRFGSEPIVSDSQLLAAVRYVHRNPIGPGLSKTCDYQWSSYREYIGMPRFTETGRVLEMSGGLTAFVGFHGRDGDDRFLDVSERRAERRRLTQDEALMRARGILGDLTFEALPGLPKDERDKCLWTLSRAGLSIRQMELVTGVGRGAIQRAIAR